MYPFACVLTILSPKANRVVPAAGPIIYPFASVLAFPCLAPPHPSPSSPYQALNILVRAAGHIMFANTNNMFIVLNPKEHPHPPPNPQSSPDHRSSD